MNKSKRSWTFLGLVTAAMTLLAGAATAQGIGQPVDGQIALQGAASPVMAEIQTFYDMVNYIIIAGSRLARMCPTLSSIAVKKSGQ